MKSIDYKITAWCRLHLPDGIDLEEVKRELEKGTDVLELAYGDNILKSKKAYESVTWEYLEETEEILEIEENAGFSTIELMNDDETIWFNGKNEQDETYI